VVRGDTNQGYKRLLPNTANPKGVEPSWWSTPWFVSSRNTSWLSVVLFHSRFKLISRKWFVVTRTTATEGSLTPISQNSFLIRLIISFFLYAYLESVSAPWFVSSRNTSWLSLVLFHSRFKLISRKWFVETRTTVTGYNGVQTFLSLPTPWLETRTTATSCCFKGYVFQLNKAYISCLILPLRRFGVFISLTPWLENRTTATKSLYLV